MKTLVIAARVVLRRRFTLAPLRLATSEGPGNPGTYLLESGYLLQQRLHRLAYEYGIVRQDVGQRLSAFCTVVSNA